MRGTEHERPMSFLRGMMSKNQPCCLASHLMLWFGDFCRFIPENEALNKFASFPFIYCLTPEIVSDPEQEKYVDAHVHVIEPLKLFPDTVRIAVIFVVPPSSL